MIIKNPPTPAQQQAATQAYLRARSEARLQRLEDDIRAYQEQDDAVRRRTPVAYNADGDVTAWTTTTTER